MALAAARGEMRKTGSRGGRFCMYDGKTEQIGGPETVI